MIKIKPFFLMKVTLLLALFMCVLILLIFRFSNQEPTFSPEEYPSFPTEYEGRVQWIVKWKEGYGQPEPTDHFQVIQVDNKRRVLLIKLHEGVDIKHWYMEWIQREDIEYIEPDHTMKISSAHTPNDPQFSVQYYLEQINAPGAWELAQHNEDLTIAILDTGIDLTHPDLQDNLVPGINLIDPGKPPQDDHGHGTELAGVLGAVGNNQIGVTGLLWSSKIMPVKVLPAEGEGSPFIVSQGIYQAVDRGVSIILMSLGGPVYSQTLADAVAYAEEHGVLLIAATGNEGGRVNYPAAFPTVLAVGAVNRENEPATYSNSGPELNVVAPGNVYTTKRGGGYGSATGTSLSAAQVAGLAGLIKNQFPGLSPNQLRNHIIYTADDIYRQGWDTGTGHGLINVLHALQTSPVADIYEPNNSFEQAAPFPIETLLTAQLRTQNDIDWYYVESPYAGTIELQFDLEEVRTSGVDIVFFPRGTKEQSYTYNVRDSRVLNLRVPKGTAYLKIRYDEQEENVNPLRYRMQSSFRIYEDAYEPNGTKEQAALLKGDGQVLVGTFHQDNMQDWYYIDVPQRGELDIHVTVDTLRLDPVLYFERPDGSSVRIDDGDMRNGQEERLVTDVENGRYFIRLHHYYDHRVNGEYYLRVTYRPYFEDMYEPNDTLEQARRQLFLQIIDANINTRMDVDWFRLRVQEERYVNLRAYRLPAFVQLRLQLYNEHQELLTVKTQQGSENQIRIGRRLKPGTYYVQVSANEAFPFDYYRLQATQQELVGGYRDIKGHWAQEAIMNMSDQGLFEGYGDYLFMPVRDMTRAEVTEVIQRMYGYLIGPDVHFEDVEQAHWAYPAIRRVAGAGILKGYADGTFAPSKSITRAEVAVIFDRLTLRDLRYRPTQYRDLSSDHWAYDSIMRLSNLGLMQGYQNNMFRPGDRMTRGEFVALVERVEQFRQRQR